MVMIRCISTGRVDNGDTGQLTGRQYIDAHTHTLENGCCSISRPSSLSRDQTLAGCLCQLMSFQRVYCIRIWLRIHWLLNRLF